MLEYLAESFAADRETMDKSMYEDNDQEVNQSIVDRLTVLEVRMDAVVLRVNHVETRVD